MKLFFIIMMLATANYASANSTEVQMIGHAAHSDASATDHPQSEKSNIDLVNHQIIAALKTHDFYTFASAYNKVENKDTFIINNDGTVMYYLFMFMGVDDPQYFDLVLKHSNPNIIDELNDITPIFRAADSCQVNKAKKLIAAGADVNYVSNKDNYLTTAEGFTPLHVAAGTKCYKLVLLLLQHGANKHVKTVNGLTPYDISVKKGNLKMTELLKL
ncbi:ankyrin repeat domain-containing protein [Psychromonas antarctica]|uniref:ankyrin repeat domain-containing protein n=1 Tax=Psychromonas antarctica TaxID=67573 RepID=UPI001EE7DB5D|nr:ankyrin repeat domain-containing protein [Psychromonas antarctica]MCG6202658.1 ankyrin repeat domain-containing protein [Psychromonas antarctica]